VLKEGRMSLVVRLRAWVWLGTVVAALAITFAGSSAWAQSSATISIGPGSPTRDVSINDRDESERYFVTRSDCRKGDKFEFKLSTTSSASARLFVYAGIGSADCTQTEERSRTDARRCFQLLAARDAEPSMTIELEAERIVSAVKNETDATGSWDPKVCEPNENTDDVSVVLYFMLFSGSASNEPLSTAKFTTAGVDLNGPSSTPDSFSARAGESQISLSWDLPSSGDFRTVRFFCERLKEPADNAGGAAGSGTGGATTGGTGGATTGGTGGATTGGTGGATTGGTGGATTGGTGGATTGGTGGATGGSGGTPSGSVEDCSGVPVALVPGRSPPSGSQYSCGSTVVPATRGVATPKALTVGQEYAVAVALEDDAGNLGPLSNVVCVEPQPVTTFYERYDRAGGTSGGAFCSISHGRLYGPAILMLGAGVLLLAFRRRSRA
jgi:hypothetical protein